MSTTIHHEIQPIDWRQFNAVHKEIAVTQQCTTDNVYVCIYIYIYMTEKAFRNIVFEIYMASCLRQ